MKNIPENKNTLYLHIPDNMEKIISITPENFNEWNIQKQFLNKKKPYRLSKDGKKIPRKPIRE